MAASSPNTPGYKRKKASTISLGGEILGEIVGFPVIENVKPQTPGLDNLKAAVAEMVAVQSGIPKRVFSGDAKFGWEQIYGGGAVGCGASSDPSYEVYGSSRVGNHRSPFETVLSRKEVDDLEIKIRSAFEYAKSLSDRGLHDEGIAMANIAECLQRLIPEYTQDGPNAGSLAQVNHPVEQITVSATSPTTAVFSSGSMAPVHLAGQMGMEFEIVFSGQNVPGFNKQSVRCRLVSVDVVTGP